MEAGISDSTTPVCMAWSVVDWIEGGLEPANIWPRGIQTTNDRISHLLAQTVQLFVALALLPMPERKSKLQMVRD
jgi:hypothetical protein